MLRLLQLRGHVLDMRLESELNISIVPPRPQFAINPMDAFPSDIRIAAHIIELTSFYLLPGVATFDSLQGAIESLRSPDVAAISKTMRQHQAEHALVVLASWRTGVLPLFWQSRDKQNLATRIGSGLHELAFSNTSSQ